MHLPQLRAYVRARCGPAVRAKESESDIVQSVCREVLATERFEYRGEGAFKGWLFQAAAHKIADRANHWRAAKRDAAREEPVDVGLSRAEAELLGAYARAASPSEAVVGREALERLEAALIELKDEYREVVLLSRIVGLSRAEIAARLGTTETAVRLRLTRGLGRLSQILRRREPGAPDAG